jgi:hypothetical protein
VSGHEATEPGSALTTLGGRRDDEVGPEIRGFWTRRSADQFALIGPDSLTGLVKLTMLAVPATSRSEATRLQAFVNLE